MNSCDHGNVPVVTRSGPSAEDALCQNECPVSNPIRGVFALRSQIRIFVFYVTFAVFYCLRISEHEYVMSGEHIALHERYQASRASEQRGENNDDVDDDKSMSY